MSEAVDPVLSANIYTSGLLDVLLSDVLVPFRNDIVSSEVSSDISFWIMRYPCRGNHLKIRVHGRSEETELVREILEPRVNSFLDRVSSGNQAVPGSEAGGSKLRTALPIDEEDHLPGRAPDPSVTWTKYCRTAVSFPPDPWLSDDTFALYFYRALSAGCGSLLTTVSSEGLSAQGRYSILARLISVAIDRAAQCADGFDKSYFEYHRDWLLRFFSVDHLEEQRLIESFDCHLSASPSSRHAFRSYLCPAPETGSLSPQLLQWSRDVDALMTYVTRYKKNPRYQIDPFTNNVEFPVFFKILHGIANQIGARPREEAFVHHALYRASQAAA